MAIWAAAQDLAARTPPTRNRYVDFLRALSILVVVIGHWLIATAWFVDEQVVPGHLLKSHPQFHWLTWVFQVMPVFRKMQMILIHAATMNSKARTTPRIVSTPPPWNS